MIRNQDRDIDNIYFHDNNNKKLIITYVYRGSKKLWELIIGYLFSKDGYSLQSKDGYILKAKDQ